MLLLKSAEKFQQETRVTDRARDREESLCILLYYSLLETGVSEKYSYDSCGINMTISNVLIFLLMSCIGDGMECILVPTEA